MDEVTAEDSVVDMSASELVVDGSMGIGEVVEVAADAEGRNSACHGMPSATFVIEPECGRPCRS